MNIHQLNGKINMVIYMIDNNLRYCREELEMTQEELGIILGASKQTISNWETGYTPIPLNKLVRFANLYNYSLDFIVGFTRNNIKYKNLIYYISLILFISFVSKPISFNSIIFIINFK